MSEEKADEKNRIPSQLVIGGKAEQSKSETTPATINQKAEPVSGPVTKNKKDRPRRKRGIMRSFFSHIIVAALAVAGVGGYFHWEDILSQTGGRVCAYEVLGKYGSSEPGTKTVAASTADSRTVEKTPEKAPEAPKTEAPVVKAPEVEQPKLVTPTPTLDEPKSDAKTTEMKADEKPAATEEAATPATTDSSDKSAVNEAAAKADAPKTDEIVASEQPKAVETSTSDEADAPKVSIVSSSDKNAFEAERDNARRTYWVDKKAAEKAYLELIAQYPDKAGIKGELGNIYVMTGSNEKAASQFLDAGMIWVKSGEKDKATTLVGLLEKLSPEKAASLKEALAKAG